MESKDSTLTNSFRSASQKLVRRDVMEQATDKSMEKFPFARRMVHRISSLSWSARIEVLDANFTIAETLTLCAAILLALSLLSLPIVFHFVEIKASIFLYIIASYMYSVILVASAIMITLALFVTIFSPRLTRTLRLIREPSKAWNVSE